MPVKEAAMQAMSLLSSSYLPAASFSQPPPRQPNEIEIQMQALQELESNLTELSASLAALKKQFEALQQKDRRAIDQELSQLKAQLQALYEFMSASLPDKVILTDAQNRPSFDEFVRAMFVGSNRELDDIKLIKLIIGRLREIFQEKLIAWKSKLNAASSLEYEMAAANLPQTSPKMTIEEVVASITTALQTDLEVLFKQIEANMQEAARQHEAKSQGLSEEILTLEEQSRSQKGELQKSQETLEKVRKALQDALQNLEQSNQRNSELTQQLSASKETSERVHNENRLLKQRLEDAQGGAAANEQSHETQKHHNQQLATQLEQALTDNRNLQADLDSAAQSLKESRHRTSAEAAQKKALQDEFEAFRSSAADNLTLERFQRQNEERRRLATELECDQLRQRCLALEKAQEKAGKDAVLADFAVKFISTLDPALQTRFKQEYDRQFPET